MPPTKLSDSYSEPKPDYDERHVEFSLAHVQGGVKGKYNKAKYFSQRVELMQEYADYLDEISA